MWSRPVDVYKAAYSDVHAPLSLSLSPALSLSLSALGLCSVLVMSVPWCSRLVLSLFYSMCRKCKPHLHNRWPHCFSVGVALQYSGQNFFLFLPLVYWHLLSPFPPTFYDTLWDPPTHLLNLGPHWSTSNCRLHLSYHWFSVESFRNWLFCSWLWFVLYFCLTYTSCYKMPFLCVVFTPPLKLTHPFMSCFFALSTAHSSSTAHFSPPSPMSLFSRVPK